MAAVQPAHGMPQQGGNPNNMARMSAGVLPPGMTKEHVQEIYKKYQTMKQSGVPDTDPEMIKAQTILRGIQNRTMMIRKQQQVIKQQQQAQAMQNGSMPQMQMQMNGSMGTAASPIDGQNLPAAPFNGGQQTQTAPTSAPTLPAMPQADGPHEQAFSKDQISTLQNQIMAFKMLQRNVPIPQDIQSKLFSSRQEQQPPTPAEVTAAATKILEDAAGQGLKAGAGPQADNKPRHRFESFVDPHSLLYKYIGYADHANRLHRPMIPSMMPLGVDPERVREEREMLVYNRIMARKNELNDLSASIGAWDTSKSSEPADNATLKRRALIEHKMLSLLPKQRALRQSISRELIMSDNLAMTANRGMYRRIKKQSLREARVTEKLEKQQRDAAENKEKRKHLDFLRSLETHAQEIRNSGLLQKSRTQKLGKLMMTTHASIEKEEQKRIERTAKQRLQALKANDEETYLKLLGQAKDSRISHLLKQTDGFLDQLASSVKEQQRASINRYGNDGPLEPEEEDVVESEEDDSKPKVDYYEVAHRKKEEVKAQSTNLVGGTLKDYQLKGLQWMISLYNNNLNGILADEMGLGKTIQTISLITYLIEKKQQPGPFLVIVPLSTLTNWNNEFEKWAPSITRIVYKGPPAQRKTQQQQIRYGNFQVLLTTYEFIIKDRPILSKVKWLHMIVDEGHRMKNASSKLSSTITQYYHTRYRLILTGTPLQNNLPELWALLNFVLPNIFKSVKSFDEWFNTPFANTGGQDKMELNEEEQLLVIKRLHKVLRPFLLRRLKKDVEKDLPDKQERVIKCNFSALQAKLYKQLVTHNKIMVTDEKSGKKTGMRGLSNMLMQLRKLCNHPFVFEEVENQMNPGGYTNDMIWRTAGKFELLDRVLPKFKETGHRVLMFFQMTQIMNIMEDFLRLRGLQYLRLDGSTKADDRSELLRQFNEPGSPYFCFLLSTRAGGLGLNLQTADTVIIYDSDWNPHQDLQAQDRAHRIGQKNEVRILRLISSNSVEEKILERAQFKLDMDGKVIQAGKFDNRSTNEERDEMLRVMLESAEAAESLEQDEMDDDDLNVLMARSEDEIGVFQRLDRQRAKDPKYGADKKLPRLLGESELPEIYMNEDNPVVEEIEFNYGRGARERTKVKYDDGLTEEQWLDAVDADDDTIEEAIARKQARIARRTAKKESRLRGEFDLGSSPPASRDSSEEPPPPPQQQQQTPQQQSKKRGRKSGPGRPTKRTAPEPPEDEPPKKRGRGAKVTETLSKEDREVLQKILDTVHDSLQDLEEQSTDPALANRGIIDPFLELPPKALYPDYYDLIKNPICMKQIEKKINRKEYQNLRHFRQDVALLCANCRQYNEDGSILYQDANLIEKSCFDKLADETKEYPQFQNYDNDTEDGGSTRPMSSVSTPQPQPARSGFRLRLNGRGANGANSSRGGTESAVQSDEE
ncbi:chromatin remodeling complex SWI/SNF component SWI2 [Polychaeton citri CBS 116435]|uniref:Chromatin remodeling complex SWI/SNF component SWI2 n=1 Tax=Polychaeton citri CBS 116435 TaxID=1314669 RepID=A0A9P4Q8T6_9PEZI|nr:chromatin remodeling complex SWI/SNF component SWI2 [Polychaeton citri CBS 116435]